MLFKDRLANGMRIVGEKMDNYRSVSIGVWIGAGSIYENKNESGAAHFIEHMLFKGTQNRSAADIAEQMDAIGGNLNAFTAKECTCFYAKVLDENVPIAAQMLADLLCCSKLDEADIEREKGVVCEEIAMTEDSPEDLAHEALCNAFYEGDPLCDPILGTPQSVNAFTRADLTAYMNRLYQPDNMVVAVAGNFDRTAIMDILNRSFTNSGRAHDAKVVYGVPHGGKRLRFIEKDIEQMNICLGLDGFAIDAPGQYPLYLLNNIIGGSMSSRLFQKIREQQGLAYSVYSSPTFYRTGGYFTLYAGTGEMQAETVVELMLEELESIKRTGITRDELERSRNQMRTGYLLGRESTSSHAFSIGRSELISGRTLTDEEILSRLDAVTMDDVMSILPIVCNFDNMSSVFVGRVSEREDRLRNIIMG